MKKSLLAVFVLIILSSCVREKDVDELKQYFDKEGYKGSFVLFNDQRNRLIFFNKDEAQIGKSPAATFEIFLSLVALETGTMKSLDDTLAWDGYEREVPIWNQDHNMMTAFKYSVAWFYRELARRMTADTIQKYLLQTDDYGDMKSTGDVDKFWLDGSFQVSPYEQMLFIKKLYKNDLPFSVENIELVKSMMMYEKQPKYTYYCKDGISHNEKHGWLIGWTEERGSSFYFALNIEMKDSLDEKFLKARYKLAQNLLEHYYLLRN